MKNDKYEFHAVMTIDVYDRDDNFITSLHTLKDSYIKIDKDRSAYIIAKDALLDIKLLRFIHNDKYNKFSDYETFIKNSLDKKITFNNKIDKKPCKLIAWSFTVDYDTNEKETLYCEIPKAEIVVSYLHEACGHGAPSSFDIKFNINADHNGDLFNMYVLK